jgi:hypothetical protein
VVTDPITPELVRALLEKATPGPWTAEHHEVGLSWWGVEHGDGEITDRLFGDDPGADAALIAAAPSIAAAYLEQAEEIRHLRAANKEHVREVEHLRASIREMHTALSNSEGERLEMMLADDTSKGAELRTLRAALHEALDAVEVHQGGPVAPARRALAGPREGT